MNAPAQSSTPGTVIADRWELIAPIGSGAMGDVWRARHLALGHEVAIKLMKPVASGNRELVQRFTREARIAAQLRHRHIARVEDFGATPDGAPWLVMELLRGESLEELFERQGRLDRETVLTVARHVGAACDVAHAAGIVHRDLKPANCFMVREEDGTAQVKVLDFGVAKAADGMKLTGVGVQLLGTPVYMSPEQTQGPSNIDGRSDLWSLAVMLFELLTGRLPFDAESLPALLVAIGHAPIPSMRAIDPTLPEALDAWTTRALDRDRERRFQTGRELADALAAALSAPLTDTRVGAPQPVAQSPLAHAATVAAMPASTWTPSSSQPPVSQPSYPPSAIPQPAMLQPAMPQPAIPQPAMLQPAMPQPAIPQPTYPHAQPAYPHSTQHWHATQHAPRPAPTSTRTALLVGLAVVLTTAVMSVVWVLASRHGDAPPRVSPEPAPTAAPAPPVTPVAPTLATPTLATPTTGPTAPTAPTVARPTPTVARPAANPSPRVRSRPAMRPAGAYDPPMPPRPVPVFGPGATSSGQRSSTGTYNPDEP
ncbi:MAG: protein kinase [Polyangiales bacterium]